MEKPSCNSFRATTSRRYLFLSDLPHWGESSLSPNTCGRGEAGRQHALTAGRPNAVTLPYLFIFIYLSFKGRAVPSGEIGSGCVGVLRKFKNFRTRRFGAANVIVHQKELVHLIEIGTS